MFSIDFTDEEAHPYDPSDGDLSPHRWVMTVLCDHRERWQAPLGFWHEPDYEAQWRAGVERIVGGADTSCLVTVMTEPGPGQIAQFWTLYRLGEEVAVHEQLWLHNMGGPLEPSAIFEAVLAAIPVRFRDRDGERAPGSEWRVPLRLQGLAPGSRRLSPGSAGGLPTPRRAPQAPAAAGDDRARPVRVPYPSERSISFAS